MAAGSKLAGVSTQKQPYKSFVGRFLASLTGADMLLAEKSRLEAFLDAVPGEYCGFSIEGHVAFSRGFAGLLGLRKIESLLDVQGSLRPDGAAALESMYSRLQESGKPFSIIVQTNDNARTLKLAGSRGKALDGGDLYYVLWLEDITLETEARNKLENQHRHTSAELRRIQSVLDNVEIPLWMRDENSELIWCNRNYGGIVGLPSLMAVAEQRELPTTAGVRKSKGGSSSPLKAMAEEALRSGAVQSQQTHSIIAGNRRLLDITEIPVKNLEVTVGMARDITREEELERKISRYVAANKELLEQLRAAIAIFAADHSLEFYNSAFAQLWDLEEQWLNTRPKLGDIMEKLRETRRLPEQADFRKFKQQWMNMFTSLIEPHEDMLHLPDGSALRMLAVQHPMGGLMTTFEDVTSRLELESSYNTLIAVQKETLDNLAEGIVVFGSDGRVKLWNPSYAALWGLNPEDLEAKPHITRLIEKRQGYFESEDWEKQRDQLIKLGLERRQREGRLVCRNGDILDYATVPLPDGGVLISWADVTDTVRVETALREKNAALEAAERLKLDFLANVSYQLRTPLNAIMGFNEILDKEYFGSLNQRQKEYTKSMHEAGERLLGLINDILDLSTIEAGYMQLDISEVGIRKMLANLLDLVREWTRKERIEIVMDCPRDIGTIRADERRIKQVLLNIIRNAIDYTPQKGAISFKVSRNGEGVEISVSDTGVGIPAEDQERVFQPFERVHRATRQDGVSARGGAGLGLTLVRNIIELHGGRVGIESEGGQGTTVRIFLPQDGKSLSRPVLQADGAEA